MLFIGLTVLNNAELASTSLIDINIKIWNLNTGSPKSIFVGLIISSIVTLKNGMLAIGLSNNNIRIYDPAGGNSIKELVGHTKPLTSLAIDINGALISGSLDNTIRIWDGNTYLFNGILNEVSSPLYFSILQNGYLAIGLSDNSIHIWDTNKVTLISDLTNAQFKALSSLALLLDGSLASISTDESIKIWNTSDFKLIKTLKFTSPNTTSVLATLLNGDLACGIENRIQTFTVV